jgi:glutathione peroxidase-family protein
MVFLIIEFTSNKHEIKSRNIDKELIITQTSDGKYLLMNITMDSIFAERYNDLQELSKTVEKLYGTDISRLVEKELREEKKG